MRRRHLSNEAVMKVLVAEDDPLIALGLAERLRSLGHEPIGPAGDGQEAVDLARQGDADLYLFDIEMPNLDGLQAAEQLTAEGLRRPVVVVTGVDDPSLIERSISSGVSAYLTKPVDSRELQAALELAAARHEEFRALEAEVERAQQALEDRKLVERAKGLLMSALNLSEQDAFRRLQSTARERNLRLAHVAGLIVEQQALLEPKRKSPST
jgi:AmiR/NasT family two-component response regulator